MEKKRKFKMLFYAVMAAFAVMIVFTHCKDDPELVITPHNPVQPIVIDRFSPDSGRVATQMLIYGKNFGGDKEKIRVEINGKKAAVINVTPQGTIIYCLVPSLLEKYEEREDGDEMTASVKVIVGENESNVPDKQLHYTFTQNVATYCGYTDEDGRTSIVDGPFKDEEGNPVAQFQSPFWLAFDTDINGPTDENGKHKKNIYLIEENNGMRFIDRDNKVVKTIFRTTGGGNGLHRPRTIAFTLDHDTMIIANDGNEWDWNGTSIIVRDKSTRLFSNGTAQPWKSVMHHKQCNGGAIHPISGDYWFNSYDKSQVYKVFRRDGEIWRYGGPTESDLNEDGKTGDKYFFRVQDDRWEFNIQIAPSGDFAYIVSKNTHYIARMGYNYAKRAFEQPMGFVGTRQRSGFKDGVGYGNTLFHEPQQGAFDKNDNFYVCDGENHCIRKITPEGQVSTFAGRPERPGYSNGALRDAQFDSPFGIIYDDEIQTFYIADRDNGRIRTIKIE